MFEHEEKCPVPYRYKKNHGDEELEKIHTNTEKDVAPTSFIRRLQEDNINRILELTNSFDLDELTTLLESDDNEDEKLDYVLFGTSDHDREKKLLQYLICLRHGLDRDSKIEKRILFKKINDLINLISRDERWPDKLLNRKCKRSNTCQCDGEGKGCRRQRILEVSLTRLQMLKDERDKLRENIKARYVAMLGVPKKRKAISRKTKTPEEKIEKLKIKVIAPVSELLGDIIKEQEIIITEEECVVRSYHIDSFYDTPEMEDSISSVASTPRVLTPDEKETVIPSWELNDDPLEHFDTSIDINAQPEVEIENQLMTDAKDLTPLPSIQRDTWSESGRKPSDQEALVSEVNESESVLPKLQVDHILEKKIEVQKEKVNTKLPKIPIESPKKKVKRKKGKPSQNQRKLKSNRPKVNIEIPKELNIVEKPLSPKMKRERKYDAPRLSARPKEPSFLEVDLGIEQPIYKIFLETSNLSNISTPASNEVVYSQNGNDFDPDDLSKSSPISVSGTRLLSASTPSFRLEYSRDCIDWNEYSQEFSRCTHEADGSYLLELNEEIDARYVRIHAKDNNRVLKNVLLRVEREDPSQESPARRKIREMLSRGSATSSRSPSPILSRERTLSNVEAVSPTVTANAEEETENKEAEDSEKMKNKFEDDLIVKIRVDSTPTRVIRPRSKVSMFQDIETESPLPPTEMDVDESAEARRHRRMLLNRKRMARQKLEAMMNLNRPVRKNCMQDDGMHFDGTNSKMGYKRYPDKDFLQKYCIISTQQQEWYTGLFKMFRDGTKNNHEDSLSLDDALDAIHMANQSLVSEGQIHYIVSVMTLLGAPMGERIDLRTFMLLIAFSEKVLSLGNFFHLTVERIDYANLLTCLVKAKQMYQIMLRHQERTIHVEDFLIELQAANVTQKDELVQHITKNNEKRKLDFLDYLTYFPLFIHTHNTITESPVS